MSIRLISLSLKINGLLSGLDSNRFCEKKLKKIIPVRFAKIWLQCHLFLTVATQCSETHQLKLKCSNENENEKFIHQGFQSQVKMNS
jgi:hypothetical protein